MRDPKGKFTEGNSGKPKGAVSKTASEVREILQIALQPEIDKLPEYFSKITEPQEKIKLLAQLLPYILPKLQTVTIDGVDNGFKLPEIIILPASTARPPVYREEDIIDPTE